MACPSGKRRLKDELAAKLALASTRRKDRRERRYYLCPRCAGYHLTKKG